MNEARCDGSDGPIHHYDAFGLRIVSEVTLPELALASGDCEPNITIRLRPLGRELPKLGSNPEFDYSDPECPVMIWPGVAAFRLVGSRLVEIEPYPDVPESYLAFPIVGPVMGWMMDRLGHYVVHASAVVIDGHSVAFLGDKMAGKSTTAAAFLRAGAQLITDDLLVLQVVEGASPKLMPAFAQLKLSDVSSAAVPIAGAEPLPLVYDGFAKRQHRLANMCREAMSADLLLVLNRSAAEPTIKALAQADAFVALTRFSYHVRFSEAPYSAATRARHFRQSVAIATGAVVAELEIPDNLERLLDVVETTRRFLREELSR